MKNPTKAEIYCVAVLNREGAEHIRLIFSDKEKADSAIDQLLVLGVSQWKIHAFAAALNPKINPDYYKYL